MTELTRFFSKLFLGLCFSGRVSQLLGELNSVNEKSRERKIHIVYIGLASTFWKKRNKMFLALIIGTLENANGGYTPPRQLLELCIGVRVLYLNYYTYYFDMST